MLLHRSRRNGLSLLEVILALAILLMSIIGLVFLMGVASNHALEAQMRSQAISIAQSRLAEVSAGVIDLSSHSLSTCDDDNDYQWSMDVEPGSYTGLFNVTVHVDERTNSLILACPEGLFKDIKKMIEEIDEASRTATHVVQVVSIKGIDPQVVQQAIDAIQGRAVRRPTTNTGNLGGFSPYPTMPFGTGTPSFNPGTPSFNPGGGFRPTIPGIAPVTQGGGRTNPAGGGRGRPPGMSDARPPGASGGRDFFEQRVKDDPEQSGLYDPQQDNCPALVHAKLPQKPAQTDGALPSSTNNSDSLLPVRYQLKAKDPKDKGIRPTPIAFSPKFNGHFLVYVIVYKELRSKWPSFCSQEYFPAQPVRWRKTA